MEFFQHEQIASLNEKEMLVYNLVCRRMKDVPGMNIRALAAEAGVSTNTVLRFCEKMGAESYTEFKYLLRKKVSDTPARGVEQEFVVPMMQYLRQAEQDTELAQKMNAAAKLCVAAEQVVFLGVAASSTLAGYGAQLLADAGLLTSTYTAYWSPPSKRALDHVVLIAVSSSGENAMVLSVVDRFKQSNAKLISITNTSTCTLASASDLNFAYYMPIAFRDAVAESGSYTTQMPVCFLLEELARQIRML